jgi:hypothetical protein
MSVSIGESRSLDQYRRRSQGLARLLGCSLVILIVGSFLFGFDAATWRERKAFNKVQIGMTKQEVGEILGTPKDEFGDEAYYRSAVRLEVWQSPQSLYRIHLKYATNRVVEKKYFEDQRRSWLRRTSASVWRTITDFFS